MVLVNVLTPYSSITCSGNGPALKSPTVLCHWLETAWVALMSALGLILRYGRQSCHPHQVLLRAHVKNKTMSPTFSINFLTLRNYIIESFSELEQAIKYKVSNKQIRGYSLR